MKAIKFTVLFLAITAMVSCQQENIEPTYTSDPTAVKLNVAVGSPFTRSNPVADGATSTEFKSGDAISVMADAQPAVQYTLVNTAWTPEAGKYLKWETNAMTFNAYYPVGVNNASMLTFDVPTDQSTLDKIEQADYMTYTSLAPEAKQASLNLALTRRMARVAIDDIILNDQYATGYTVTEIKISGNTTGYAAAGTTKSGNVQVQSYKQDGKFYALLSPTTAAAAATFFTITVTKTADSSTETLIVKAIPTLDAGKSYAYTVAVGKNTVKIESVTVSDWTTGGILPGGEAESTIEVSPDTHTLTVLKPGFLTTNHIATALGGGTELTVSGTLNADDVAKLTATTSLTGIDLRGVTYPAATRAVGTVPSADWSGCTNLRTILINPADAAAYKAAWSAASDKLLYLGKERVHKVDAMTDELNKNGVPCVVIGITGFEPHRLISRNPYCSSDDETKIGILGTANLPIGCEYSKLAAAIQLWGGKVATLDDLEALVPLRPNSFTEVTREENGNTHWSIRVDDSFVVDSDGSQYVKKYRYNKDTKEFTLGYQYGPVNIYGAGQLTFITFDVTNP